jgi:hypothetical protein
MYPGGEVQNVPLVEIIAIAESLHEMSGLSPTTLARVRDEMVKWKDFPASRQRAVRVLRAFEGWNLFVIFLALVGFNHVSTLAACPWTLPALWPVGVVTVAVTGYCVFVWTEG